MKAIWKWPQRPQTSTQLLFWGRVVAQESDLALCDLHGLATSPLASPSLSSPSLRDL